MKKKSLLLLLIATSLVLNVLSVCATSSYGDLNADGAIDSTDLTIMKRSLLKYMTIDDALIADLNGDGDINSTDLTLLKRYLLKKINKFPVESLNPTMTPNSTPDVTPTPLPSSSVNPTNSNNQDFNGSIDALIGSSVQSIVDIFGEPDRVDLSRYGFDWYIYNHDLTKYIQIGIKNGKTVGAYTNSLNYNLNDNIGVGESKSKVEEDLGDPLSYILKGNIMYRIDNSDECQTFNVKNSYYATVFYDVIDGGNTTSFLLVDFDTENSFRGYYGEPSEELCIS